MLASRLFATVKGGFQVDKVDRNDAKVEKLGDAEVLQVLIEANGPKY